MVGDKLKPDLVKVLNSSTESSVVWSWEAQVAVINEIGEQKGMDQDVSMFDACDGKDGIEKASDEEDTRVESLTIRCRVHAQVKWPYLSSHGISFQIIAISMEYLCENDGKKDQNQKGKDAETKINAFHICAHAEHRQSKHGSNSYLKITLQDESKYCIPKDFSFDFQEQVMSLWACLAYFDTNCDHCRQNDDDPQDDKHHSHVAQNARRLGWRVAILAWILCFFLVAFQKIFIYRVQQPIVWYELAERYRTERFNRYFSVWWDYHVPFCEEYHKL